MPVVRVSWFEGKDHATKQKVAAEITDSIVRNTATDPNYIYVIFEDVKPSDWAGAGKLYGSASDAALPLGSATSDRVVGGVGPQPS